MGHGIVARVELVHGNDGSVETFQDRYLAVDGSRAIASLSAQVFHELEDVSRGQLVRTAVVEPESDVSTKALERVAIDQSVVDALLELRLPSP